MTTKVQMDVDEYLRTSFDGADCEFVDGEIVERNMGELEHSDVQGTLFSLLRRLRPRLGIRVNPELRIRIDARRYRVPDLSVFRNDDIGTRIPSVAPFLAIEILSPEDRMTRMLPKIQEYFSIGVEHVWVIDPEEKTALSFTAATPGGQLCDVLRTENPPIEIPLASVFDLNA
jgi:Uma2 family endonuclease